MRISNSNMGLENTESKRIDAERRGSRGGKHPKRLTKNQKEMVEKWIKAQTYSSMNHQESEHYLLAEELHKYLPSFIEKILNNER